CSLSRRLIERVRERERQKERRQVLCPGETTRRRRGEHMPEVIAASETDCLASSSRTDSRNPEKLELGGCGPGARHGWLRLKGREWLASR
ncbi:hypothetical protein TSAR_000119, partial [Trichomalopsis sarcophagae]